MTAFFNVLLTLNVAIRAQNSLQRYALSYKPHHIQSMGEWEGEGMFFFFTHMLDWLMNNQVGENL